MAAMAAMAIAAIAGAAGSAGTPVAQAPGRTDNKGQTGAQAASQFDSSGWQVITGGGTINGNATGGKQDLGQSLPQAWDDPLAAAANKLPSWAMYAGAAAVVVVLIVVVTKKKKRK